LIVGEPGSGKTSLLSNIRANVNEGAAPDVILVDARVAGDARDLIDILLKEAVDEGCAETSGSPDRDDPFALVSQIRRLRDAPDGSMMLLDDPDVEPAATLFGRLRDELWQLPVWFIVAVNPSTYSSVLSQPPANAFFDVVIELEPLEPNVAVEMLRRRKHLGELAEDIAKPAQAMQPRAVVLSA
jgi:AAA domain